MAKSNNQKGKILYLERLLRGTGDDRAVSMQDILAYLLENGIHAERKSIYDDMEVLRSFGMDIRYRRGRPGGYYLAGREASDLNEVPGRANNPVKHEGTAEPVNPGGEGSSVLFLTSQGTERADGAFFSGENPEGEVQLRRQVKLVCSPGLRSKAEAYLGPGTEFRDKSDGTVAITASVLDGPEFYGWLTAMGLEMRLVKPRKMQQAYRDYLKEIAREYKRSIVLD